MTKPSVTPSQGSSFETSFLQFSPDGILVADAQLHVTAWNPALQKLTGRTAAAATGKTIQSLFSFLQLKKNTLASLKAGQEVLLPEVAVPHLQDGRVSWCRAHLFPIMGAGAKPEGYIVTFRQLGHPGLPGEAAAAALPAIDAHTEPRWQADLLSLQHIVDAIPCIITIYDLAQGKHLYFNRQMQTMLGFSFEQIDALGDAVFVQMIHPEDLPRLVYHIGMVAEAADGHVIELEYRIKDARGSWHWFVVRASVFQRNAQGLATRALAVFIDNTEARKNLQILTGVLDSSLTAIIALEPASPGADQSEGFVVTLANAAAARLTGCSAEELEGQPLEQCLPLVASAEYLHHFRQVVQSRKPYRFEHSFESEAGQAWLEGVAVAMGEGFVLTLSDVTDRKKAAQDLAESRDFIRKVTDRAPFVITVFDLEQQTYTFINRLVPQLLGYTEAEVLAMRPEELQDLFHPDLLAALPAHYRKLEQSEDGTFAEIEFRLRNKEGRYHWLVSRDTVFRRTADGKVAAVLSYTKDIHELKRSKDLLNAVLNSSLTGISAMQAVRNAESQITDLRYMLVNSIAEQLLGRSAAETTGRLMTELNPGVRESGLLNAYIRVIETGEPFRTEYFYRVDGQQRCYLITGVKMEDGITLSVTDISQLKAAEEKNRQNEALLQEAQQIANLGIWEWDIVHNRFNWSENLFEIFGYTQPYPQPQLWHYLNLLATPDKELVELLLQQCQESLEPFTFTHPLTTPSGQVKHIISKGHVVTDSHRLPVRMVGTVMDVSELVEMREALERAKQLQLLGEAIPQIVWAANAAGATTYVNREWETYLGRHDKQVTSKTWMEIIHPDDRERCAREWAHAIQSRQGYQIEFRLRRFDGSFRWQLGRAVPIPDEQGQLSQWFGTCTDIHDQKEAQEQLQEDINRFRFLAETIPQMVWTTNEKGEADYFNQRWYAYTGLSPEACLGYGWTQAVHEEDLQHTQRRFKQALKSGEMYHAEYRLRKSDGTYRWHLARGEALKDELGVIKQWFGTSTDIHDQKRAVEELQAAQAALAHYNRELAMRNEELRHTNADLDNFIYTASHDLKAPISNIEGLLEVLENELGSESGAASQVLLHMQRSILRFKNTLRELTEVSKAERDLNDESMQIKLPVLLQEVQADLYQLVKESKARITWQLEVTELWFSRKNMRSIIYNLLANAVKYRDVARQPEIIVRTALSGHRVQLEVQDNGMGIDPLQVPKVFEMFRRAHTHVEGSGIGLYIVKRIVENAGGTISVKSEAGKGSTFTIYLPQ